MSRKFDEIKLAIIGDSIAEGLGVKSQCYGDIIRGRLEKATGQATLLNVAHTGYQVSDSLKLLQSVITFDPSVIIIAHGITEALVRPKQEAMRFVPPRWRQIGWLDPRPYFSRHLWKNLYHRTESEVRWRIKVYLIERYGGNTMTSAVEFERLLTETLDMLVHQTSAKIVLLTHNGIDERFYPGSLLSLDYYKSRVIRVAAEYQMKQVEVCDVSSSLSKWTDYFEDHFHPNAVGHSKIAEALYEVIQQ